MSDHEGHSEMSGDEQAIPVKAKAVLIDPASLTVVWMNESAAQGLGDPHGHATGDVPLESVVPMAESLGVPEAVRAVADTGVARHLQTKLVSTTRGSVTIVMSMYRLPDGPVLLVIENAWQPRESAGGGSRRSTGRPR